MSHTLPDRCYHTGHYYIVEETLQDQRRTLQVITANINAHKAADGTAGRDSQQPVPLPPASHGLPRPIQRQEPLPVFPQAHQRKHDRRSEHGRERDPQLPMLAQVLDWRVAGGAIDKGPIQKHLRSEDAEREKAVRPVREGPVRVQRVVEVVERGAVEVDIVDNYVCPILALLEWDELPDGDQRHDGR